MVPDGVVGTLTKQCLLNYGNWGGHLSSTLNSSSEYFNNELASWTRSCCGLGARREDVSNVLYTQSGRPGDPPVPAGTVGLVRPGYVFRWNLYQTQFTDDSHLVSVGANYTIFSNLAVYARYATEIRPTAATT